MTWQQVVELLAAPAVLGGLRALVIAAVGVGVTWGLAMAAGRVLRGFTSAELSALGRRLLFYGGLFLVAAAAAREVGFDLTVLLGAAGVLTVAVGFASQTSASNVISGVFLVFEKPFTIGEVVRIDDMTGQVLSIDLLSVKLRTFDNLLVRVPNETVMKARITNLTRLPIRRFDLLLSFDYDTDPARVRELLLDVAERSPIAMEEPAPVVMLTRMTETGVEIQFSTWAPSDEYVRLRDAMMLGTHRALAEAGIDIALPRRTLTIVQDSRSE